MLSKSFLLLFGLLLNIENYRAQTKFLFNFYSTHVSDRDFFTSYHSYNDDSSLSNFDFEDINHKISGGSYATHGQFPFMAIVHRLVGNGRYYVCGGSILSERWVLTAGHCIVNKPRKFFVVFGIVDKSGLKYDSSNGDGVSMLTTQGAVHPKYNRGLNDIGLLYMPKEIPFSETIKPIKIADHSQRFNSFSETTANIYGWGKGHRTGASNLLLKYGKVSVISNGQCRLVWTDVDDTRLCTISTGDDVCQGDSGGPLVVYDDEDDEPLQIGIVSYGDAGCPSRRPAVFTRVSTFANWIKRITGIDYD